MTTPTVTPTNDFHQASVAGGLQRSVGEAERPGEENDGAEREGGWGRSPGQVRRCQAATGGVQPRRRAPRGTRVGQRGRAGAQAASAEAGARKWPARPACFALPRPACAIRLTLALPLHIRRARLPSSAIARLFCAARLPRLRDTLRLASSPPLPPP